MNPSRSARWSLQGHKDRDHDRQDQYTVRASLRIRRNYDRHRFGGCQRCRPRIGRERFRAQDADQLELNASVLLAALRQHVRADAAAGHLSSEAALVETLLALDCGLSPREAEVAAALVMGETQAKIAQSREISPATVITYRRRAYGKLGVARTRDLTALLR